MSRIEVTNAGVFIDAAVIAKAIGETEVLSPGKHVVFEPELFGERRIPFTFVVDKEVWNIVEYHIHEADLWICHSGQARFIYGGEMVNPWMKDGNSKEKFSNEIRGGIEVILRPGDHLFIPAGVPHQHGSTGTAVLEIVKIPNPATWDNVVTL